MIAIPWYLLAAGAVLLVLGYLIAMMAKSNDGDRNVIDTDMDDEEIARKLRDGQGISLSGILILLGLLCIFVSIVWRLVRWLM